MPTWVIPKQLARGSRPGYSGEGNSPVSRKTVDAWLAEVRSFGIKSIVCLLAEDQLCCYGDLPTDLISYYRNAGFSVEHVPAKDRQSPPLSQGHLDSIWAAYQALAKPVLVHCSAGCDRTGRAVDCIKQRLSAKG